MIRVNDESFIFVMQVRLMRVCAILTMTSSLLSIGINYNNSILGLERINLNKPNTVIHEVVTMSTTSWDR